jgi:hypothetical protein
MKKYKPADNSSPPISDRPTKRLTQKQLGMFNETIREFTRAAISVIVACLFYKVIDQAITQHQPPTPLLNTALALVASALGIVLKYFLGRPPKDK